MSRSQAADANEVGLSAEADRVLSSAETIANDMKDEYISVEHIMLALIVSKDRTFPSYSALSA